MAVVKANKSEKLTSSILVSTPLTKFKNNLQLFNVLLLPSQYLRIDFNVESGFNVYGKKSNTSKNSCKNISKVEW